MRVLPCLAGALCALALSTVVDAQNVASVIPNIGTGTASSSSSYPWNRRTSSIRVQYIYDSEEMPLTPINITRIRFRPSDAAATTTTWTGGTYGGITMMMSTAAVDYTKFTTTFSTNHGTDVTTVYAGSVKLAAGSGTGANVPSNYYVDITLQKPFTYDPRKGDFLLDIASDGSKYTGGTTTTNAVTFTSEGKKVARMFNLTSHTATTGSLQATVGLVAELTYTQVPGIYPSFTTVGTTKGPAPLKVNFKDNSVDTKGPITVRLWDMDNNGSNDVTGNNPTPSWTYNKPGSYDVKLTVIGPSGTSSLTKKAVAFVCGGANEGSITTVLTGGNGLTANNSGNLFDVEVKNKNGVKITSIDIVTRAAVNTTVSIDVYITPTTYVGNNTNAAVWTKVATGSGPSKGGAGTPTPINVNDFYLPPGKHGMYINYPTGGIHYTNANASNSTISNCDLTLTLGIAQRALFSGGIVNGRVWNGTLHYAADDKAATGPYGYGCVGSNSQIPQLSLSADPVVGTTVKINIANMVNVSSGPGLLFLGLMQKQTDLTGFGMPNCALFNEALVTLGFVNTSGSASLQGAIPNKSGLVGLQIFMQSANADVGTNPLGVAASPGLASRIGNK